jgi:hypothetical protein
MCWSSDVNFKIRLPPKGVPISLPMGVPPRRIGSVTPVKILPKPPPPPASSITPSSRLLPDSLDGTVISLDSSNHVVEQVAGGGQAALMESGQVANSSAASLPAVGQPVFLMQSESSQVRYCFYFFPRVSFIPFFQLKDD